jgi:hypothetical protein
LTRTREMPIQDWVSQSSNWIHTQISRYPASPSSPVVSTTVNKGNLAQTSPALRGRKITSDENHGFSVKVDLSKPDRKFTGDLGGPFNSNSHAVTVENGGKQHVFGEGVYFQNWLSSEYYGPVFAVDPRSLPVPDPPLSNLRAKGTTAIARCKPTNNVANLAVSLAEIFHGGLPALPGVRSWKTNTSAAKKAGDEYLNHQFGWLPLASDVRDVSYAAANAHRLLKAYEHNSGKIVRRGYQFPVEETEETVVIGNSDGFDFDSNRSVTTDFSKPRTVLHKTTRTYKRTWFSGAFTYHLPIGYKSRFGLVEAAAKAGPLLGIELTPEVVWSAVPWTWAVDWFSNAGDVVSNVSDWATDGLVLKWGYIMEHSVSSVTYNLVGTCRLKPYGTIQASPVTTWSETKRREKATPFGFETTWNTLSPRQLAIATALGISRIFS